MWRLRMIGEGRMDSQTACSIIPSEADLLASEAAFLHEAEQAKHEIAARKDREELVSAAEKQDTFFDGKNFDTISDAPFCGLDEFEFKLSYGVFERTFAELHGLKAMPPYNSKYMRGHEREDQ